MSKTPEEMNDDDLDAAQRAADGEADESLETEDAGATEEETDGTESTEQAETTETDASEKPEGATETTTQADPAAAEAQTSAVAEQQKPAGVASKDGTRVLPYAALQAERRSSRQNAARADRAEKETERLRQEIADLRAGKSSASGELTEDEVQQLENDFPEHGKKVRAAFERAKELEKQVAATKPKDDDVADDPVQEAIDQVPRLVEWQHDTQHQDKWQRAIELDNALMNSPKWKGKPDVDRFAHVASLVEEEFDIAPAKPPAKPKASSTTKPSPDTKKVIEQADTTPPNTLSDLKGGSVPDHGQVNFEKMGTHQMLNRFMDMTPEEIDRQLARLG